MLNRFPFKAAKRRQRTQDRKEGIETADDQRRTPAPQKDKDHESPSGRQRRMASRTTPLIAPRTKIELVREGIDLQLRRQAGP